MGIDVYRIEQAFRRNARARGVSVHPVFERGTIALLVEHQVDLWERALEAALKAIPSSAYIADVNQRTINQVVNQIYNRYTNIDRLGEALKRNYKRGGELHKVRFLREMRLVLGTSVEDLLSDGGARAEIQQGIDRSVGLIRTLSVEMSAQIGEEIWKGVSSGRDEFSLRKYILDRSKLPAWRARLIARDQTGTLFSKLSEVRQKDIGVSQYRWRTAGDMAVRDTHEELSNTLQEWAHPPGVGNPGEDIQCRCVADPVLDTAKLF